MQFSRFHNSRGEIEPLIARVITAWNIAEQDIKRTEMIRHEALAPAVWELRYAGRHLIDAMQIGIGLGADLSDEEAIERVKLYLTEAEATCHQASQDAIDALILYIHGQLDQWRNEYGYGEMSTPAMVDLSGKMRDIEEIVTESREKRGIQTKLYDDIRQKYLPQIIEIYLKLRQPTEVERRRRQQRLMFSLVLVGVISAAISGISAWLLTIFLSK